MMSHVTRFGTLGLLALLALSIQGKARADGPIKTVFVIAMENHNWTQPANKFSGPIQQIFQNPNAPFINSLVNGTAGKISRQVAYATNYHNVLATASGNNPHIHPSEPNYIWAEAGTNFGVFNDADPFPNGTNNQTNNQDNQLHLVRLLTDAGRTWRSYQEDIDLTMVGGQLTNVVLPKDQWTVPLDSFSGTFASGSPVNQFNHSMQFNYAAKHNPQVFFTDSNGGDNTTPSNPLSHNYAPLQQLFVDLANNSVADYNWITPNQFNDMHTALSGGFMGQTGDAANIRQGDNFLSIVVPAIMASDAYQDRGAIIIWWDETEQDAANANPDDFNHTIGEIVISPLAHPNVNGLPFASSVLLSHSSDLRTMQKIFHVTRPLFLGDAVHANDLSSLFAEGVIPRDRDNEKDSF
jgi:phosphatidylinositol-3-phosphatase